MLGDEACPIYSVEESASLARLCKFRFKKFMMRIMNDELHAKYQSIEDLQALPHWDEHEVAMLWSKDWWDGPLNGMIAYRGSHYWFDYCFDDGEGVLYYYLAFEISSQESASAEDWRSALADKQAQWKTSKQEDPAWFFKDVMVGPEFSNRQPLAWFCSGDSGDNKHFYAIQVTPPPTSSSDG